MSLGHVFTLLCIVWGASELWIGWRRRSADTARTRDAGTLRMILITVYACLALAIWLATTGWGRFPAEWQRPLLWIGMAAMAAGMAFRWWAIRVLAQYFTVDVAIRDDHRIVRDGPYRVLRHPSYTGSLCTFYGCALALGNVCSLLVIVVPVTLAFLWRMRIEERVLAQAFPTDYPDYARSTKRLLPYVW